MATSSNNTQPQSRLLQRKFPGFRRPTTTPVPDELFDDLLHDLTGAELKVVLYICRRTFGFKKDSDTISLNQIADGIVTRDGRVLDRGTGLSQRHVQRAVKSLEEQGIIEVHRQVARDGVNEINTYSLHFENGVGTFSPYGRDKKSLGVETLVSLGVETPVSTTTNSKQETVIQHDVVVDALTNFGISGRVAQKLTDAYPEDYLLQKLDLVQWMVATGSSLVGKNPAGYLRRAIEDDYLPPPQYQTAAQRQKHEETLQAARQGRQEAEEEHRRTKERLHQLSREEHPPQPVGEDGLTTESAWSLTLEQLKEQTPRPTFETWLKDTMLLEVTGNTAQVMVPSQFALDWLEKRMYQSIARTLGNVLQQEMEVEFVAQSDS